MKIMSDSDLLAVNFVLTGHFATVYKTHGTMQNANGIIRNFEKQIIISDCQCFCFENKILYYITEDERSLHSSIN